MSKKLFAWVFLFVLSLTASLQAQYNLFYSFAGGTSDGSRPYGSLIISGSTLYGMTYEGGAGNFGTIFKVNKDGTGFALLHSFARGAADGAYPYASLIRNGSTLYGMTYAGGTADCGTIFRISKDGTGFALLHSFAGGTSDGAYPLGSLIASGSVLYGMTYSGGTSGMGTIFKVNKNGTGYTLLYSFAGATSDGANPYGSLIISGSTLYGMTYAGGTADCGTIFRISKDGTGFVLLHSFTGGAADGLGPCGSLIIKGSILYGMTLWGGANELGTIFAINKNGTGYTMLHSFAGGAADGQYPDGSLIAKGSTLYGMTREGGVTYGTLFKINKNGTGFALLHSFAGPTSDGSYPEGLLLMKGSMMYGLTPWGGTSDNGTIFSFKLK